MDIVIPRPAPPYECCDSHRSWRGPDCPASPLWAGSGPASVCPPRLRPEPELGPRLRTRRLGWRRSGRPRWSSPGRSSPGAATSTPASSGSVCSGMISYNMTWHDVTWSDPTLLFLFRYYLMVSVNSSVAKHGLVCGKKACKKAGENHSPVLYKYKWNTMTLLWPGLALNKKQRYSINRNVQGHDISFFHKKAKI